MSDYKKTVSNAEKPGKTRRQVLDIALKTGFAGYALTTPFIARAASSEKEVVFGAAGGGNQTAYLQKFAPAFTKETGIKVTYIAGQPADLLAKVRVQRSSPSIDVIFLGGSYSYQAVDEKLVVAPDLSMLPNASLIVPSLNTEKALVPIGVATAGLLTNNDAFAKHGFAAPTSWLDCWDPKFKGHIGLYSINTAATNGMLITVSQQLTGQYKNLDAAFAKFKALRPNMLDFYQSAGAWDTAMQQGDLWLGCNTATRALQMKMTGMPVGFPILKDKLVGYGNFLGLVNHGPNPTAAHLWINYLLSTQAQQLQVTAIGYNSVNRDVVVPAAIKPYFPDISDLFIPDWRYISTQTPKIVNRWNTEIET